MTTPRIHKAIVWIDSAQIGFDNQKEEALAGVCHRYAAAHGYRVIAEICAPAPVHPLEDDSSPENPWRSSRLTDADVIVVPERAALPETAVAILTAWGQHDLRIEGARDTPIPPPEMDSALLDGRIRCVCGRTRHYNPDQRDYICHSMQRNGPSRPCSLRESPSQPDLDREVWNAFCHFVLDRRRLVYELHRRQAVSGAQAPSSGEQRALLAFADRVRSGLALTNGTTRRRLFETVGLRVVQHNRERYCVTTADGLQTWIQLTGDRIDLGDLGDATKQHLRPERTAKPQDPAMHPRLRRATALLIDHLLTEIRAAKP